MLTVSAKEQRSGQHAQVSVQAGHGLSQDEVERLVLESVEHAHSDFAMRRFIELKNKADADLRHTEKALVEAGEQIPSELRQHVESVQLKLRAAMEGSDVNSLQQALDAFGHETQPLAEMLMNAVVKATLAGKKMADS